MLTLLLLLLRLDFMFYGCNYAYISILRLELGLWLVLGFMVRVYG